ncbi:MAG TPA: metalloregulator ArsR/SmtB family transcription factor [Gaiellales bacterium]|jgi:ArsR family transcriptional regulator
MPFDEPLSLPPSVHVQPSAAIELSWLVIGCGKRNAVHQIAYELEDEADSFWGDGERMLTEVLVIAQQLGCITGWDIDPMLNLSSARLDPKAELDLSTESEHERQLVRERLARLASDKPLRTRYERLLRRVWADGEPQLRELGRPTVERAVQRICASLEHGQSPYEQMSSDHIARRDKFRPLMQRAIDDGTLVLTPCYLAGGHGHIVALPGLLSVAVGTGVTSDMARQRATAERVARDMKLLSDPTRVLILMELDRTPATVGEIAVRVGVAQPTASVHVRQLREAALLESTKDGGSATYRVDRDRLRESLQRAHDALLPTSVLAGIDD